MFLKCPTKMIDANVIIDYRYLQDTYRYVSGIKFLIL